MDEQIEKLMSLLGCTQEEAEQVIADDKAIDQGAKLFELTPEQQQASKQYRQADHKKPTVYQFQKRERKANDDKRELIAKLADLFAEYDCEISNPERQIEFVYNKVRYRIVLSAPRK